MHICNQIIDTQQHSHTVRVVWLVSLHPEMGRGSFALPILEAGVLPERPMWFAGVGLGRRTTLAVRDAMEGSPSEAEAMLQPEVDSQLQK